MIAPVNDWAVIAPDRHISSTSLPSGVSRYRERVIGPRDSILMSSQTATGIEYRSLGEPWMVMPWL